MPNSSPTRRSSGYHRCNGGVLHDAHQVAGMEVAQIQFDQALRIAYGRQSAAAAGGGHALPGRPGRVVLRAALPGGKQLAVLVDRSEEHTSELQSLMRISYAVFCLKKKKDTT